MQGPPLTSLFAANQVNDSGTNRLVASGELRTSADWAIYTDQGALEGTVACGACSLSIGNQFSDLAEYSR